MVKLKIVMNSVESQSLPVQPSPIRAITAGFETVANHIGLVLLPLALDVFLWLGPHISIRQLAEPLIPWLQTTSTQSGAGNLANPAAAAYTALFDRVNLFSFLRIYPIGVPSLISGGVIGVNPFQTGSAIPVSPVEGSPFGPVPIWQSPSTGFVLLVVIGLWIVGLILGVVYFSLVAQGALAGKVQISATLRSLPWLALHIALLTIGWLGLTLALMAPFFCMLVVALLTVGFGAGQLVAIIYFSLLVWVLFPMMMSPLAIFARMQTAWTAAFSSIRITRYTLIQTGAFFLMALAISEGLNLLWRIPAETSWLAGVGILGHAVISTALVAAAFIYFQDADRFVHKVTELNKTVQA
jgi:hypothetical protein